MRTCDNCGAQVADGDTFCGTCGTFLAWERDPAAPQPPAVPARAEPVPTEPTPTEPAPAEPVPAQPAPAQQVPAQQVPGEQVPAEQAPAEPVAVVEPPGAVQPGRPVAPRPVVREFPDGHAAAPDDTPCPACGAMNRSGRRFCRRCGRSLVAVVERVHHVPWWRRLRWRPRWSLGTILRRLLTLLLILAVLAGVAVVAVRYGGRAVDAVRDRIAKPAPVRPDAVTASSSAAGHPASAVVDGLTNRFWAPATTVPPQGQYVEMTFTPPFRLLDLIVHSGVAPEEDAFTSQARPAELELTTWSADGTSSSTTLHLADQPGEQKFHHVAGSVIKIRLTIRSCYGTVSGHETALAEVELFKRP
jgi:zinc-ribbon domain